MVAAGMGLYLAATTLNQAVLAQGARARRGGLLGGLGDLLRRVPADRRHGAGARGRGRVPRDRRAALGLLYVAYRRPVAPRAPASGRARRRRWRPCWRRGRGDLERTTTLWCRPGTTTRSPRPPASRCRRPGCRAGPQRYRGALGPRASGLDRGGRRRDLARSRTAEVLTWVALIGVPLGAALALGWAARGSRPALAGWRRPPRPRLGAPRRPRRPARQDPDGRLGDHPRAAARRRGAVELLKAGVSRWPWSTPISSSPGTSSTPNAVLVAAAPARACRSSSRPRSAGRPRLRRLPLRGGRRRHPRRRAAPQVRSRPP